MNKKTFPVIGMHCRSCEILLEEEIGSLPQVKKVKASTKNHRIDVYSKSPIDENLIAQAIESAGYKIGQEDRDLITKDPQKYKDLFIAAGILALVYLAARLLGLDKIATSSGSSSSNLLVVFVIGITAGLSTCMALVGGLVLGISARHAEKHPEATPLQKFRPHLYFNLGRVISYFILGGLIGQLGSAFKLSGSALGIITIFVGIIMFVLGLQLIEIFPRLAYGFTLPKFLINLLKIKNKEEKEYSHKNSMIVGALTFFLPCGFTQAMQVLSVSTGSFVAGALIMGVFALGTTPGLLGIGGLTSYLKNGSASRKFFKFVGLAVIALAIFNFSNGLNLVGIKAYFAQEKPAPETIDIKEENGFQILNMDQVTFGYKPNKLKVAAGKPVKWIVNSKDSNTCASSLYAPKLKVMRGLEPGENVIEFPAQKPGRIPFSCSMGMYSGYIDVVSQ